MSRGKKRWLIGIGAAAGAGAIAVLITARELSKRFEPYIREQAIQYLEQRFNSEVELAALRVSVPKSSPWNLVVEKGRGVLAVVEGEGISLRHRGRRDVPPMFAMRRFRFEVDIGKLFEKPVVLRQIALTGMEITVPPKGQRPKLGSDSASGPDEPKTNVVIEDVLIDDARLAILPKDKTKFPLEFDIHRVRLRSAGNATAMDYAATLTNAKPPGEIRSKGTFGPWNADEPGDTPLGGEYTFEKADLGVFAGIAGTLKSTGEFGGSLSSIDAKGQATVPDFRLKMAGNPVPLATKFEVLVDGTNGNTILKPVHATIGATNFTTSGGVLKHEGDQRRAVRLAVWMPRGNVPDLLKLAMKGQPFMEGRIVLKTSIDIPPLVGKIREKLLLDGKFEVTDGKFLKSTIQDQIDSLSRRGQGQPKNERIDEVVSNMKGVFTLENENLRFHSLSFRVPGANVDLAGDYDLDRDDLDFRGTLRLRAKVSQTMTGWKRWALKPVDPFFSKGGAGTLLKIKVDGTSREPKFGLDRGRKAD